MTSSSVRTVSIRSDGSAAAPTKRSGCSSGRVSRDSRRQLKRVAVRGHEEVDASSAISAVHVDAEPVDHADDLHPLQTVQVPSMGETVQSVLGPQRFRLALLRAGAGGERRRRLKAVVVGAGTPIA